MEKFLYNEGLWTAQVACNPGDKLLTTGMKWELRILVTLKVILWCMGSCAEKPYKETLEKQWNWSGWTSLSEGLGDR